MQRINPIDDLLQGTGRNDPGQNHVSVIQLGSSTPEPCGWPDGGNQPLVRKYAVGVPLLGGRTFQLAALPAGASGQYGQTHRYLVSTPTRASRPPVAKLGRSPAIFLKPGVLVPFLSASIEEK